jgi:hypothetical protein
VGLIFKDIKNPHNEITIKKAKPDAKYESQRVDYISYTRHGSQHIARNGDRLYDNGGNIMRIDSKTQKATVIPQAELQKLGVTKSSNHPDVHITVSELANLIKMIGGKK